MNLLPALTVLADRLHRLTGLACIALLGILILSQFAVVVLRFGFSTGNLWLQDLPQFAFGALAMLAIPFALGEERHVRLERSSAGAWVPAASLVLLLLLAGYALYGSWAETIQSLQLREGSAQIGGLPFYFAVKAMFPLAMILSILQGAARIAIARRP